MIKIASLKIGEIVHYYDKIQVAVVDLSSTLSVGDKISVKYNGEELFSQKVESIQIEHEKVDSASSGTKIGLKLDKEAKQGAEIYKD